MTLLVGVLCKNGAVIAADRQASHGVFGQATVGQPMTKITAVSESILFASSGAVGLGQQLCHVISTDTKEIGNRNYHSYATSLQKKLREVVDPAFQTAAHAARVIGAQAANSDAICGSLLAARFKDGVKLIEISPQCGLEHLSDGIPFVCLGSGKPNADPFLRYIWSIFFDEKAPNLNEAILAAYWTVKVAIDLRSTGVGFSPDVFVLDGKDDKKVQTREVTGDELTEAVGLMKEAEDSWRSIRATMGGQVGAETVPPVPN